MKKGPRFYQIELRVKYGINTNQTFERLSKKGSQIVCMKLFICANLIFIYEHFVIRGMSKLYSGTMDAF